VITNPNLAPVNCVFPKSSNSGKVWAFAVGDAFGTELFFDPSTDSSRRFKILNSLVARSSNPNDTSFPINTDIPFSS
jgi:hypothetical protein